VFIARKKTKKRGGLSQHGQVRLEPSLIGWRYLKIHPKTCMIGCPRYQTGEIVAEPKGFIGVCTNDTQQECFDRMLFGSIRSWQDKVRKVRKGDIGFLYNLDTNVLHGIFVAETDGGSTIVADAWQGRFPVQVKVSWKKKCEPLENGRELLEGVGTHYARYILTLVEAVTVSSLFESPDQMGVVSVRSGIRPTEERPYFKTEDGHYVRSKAECIIDNWLYNRNLAHAYERRVPIEEEILCDFYVPLADCYLEYWGLEESEDYQKRKEKKVTTYHKHGLRLIGIRDKDVQQLDDALPRRLRQYLPKDFVLR